MTNKQDKQLDLINILIVVCLGSLIALIWFARWYSVHAGI
jgi:hypothetical protein